MAQIPEEAERFSGEVRERVRQAMARQLEDAHRSDKHGLRVGDVRAAARCEMSAASALVGLWRAGKISLADSWADPAPAGGGAGAGGGAAGDGEAGDEGARRLAVLERRVRAAMTDGDREALAHELAALVAAGTVPPAVAREIRGALADARASADARREHEPPPEDPTRLCLVSAAALEVARALDFIVDDARRERIAAYVASELNADMAQHPNVDMGGGGGR